MLITEMITINNKQFRHNYSNEGYYIKRNDGQIFVDALDIPEATWSYVETNEKIPLPPEPELEQDEVLNG